MTALTDEPEVGQTDAALLVEELIKIYSTPTPKVWPELKKGKLYLIDWMSFTIARVQSYSSMTHYNLWYIKKHS